MSLLKDFRLKGRVLYSEPLCRHTTFRIGGPVKIWAEPKDLDDILYLLEISKAQDLPIFLIGEGTNLLVSDEGLNAIAVSLGDSFQAGRKLQKFILDTIDAGYSGLEFLAGVPGTIGGAVRMNAGGGIKGPWISDFIERLKVCDLLGRISYMEKKALGFGYRESGLKDLIILEAEFNLRRAKDKGVSKNGYKKYLMEKRDRQELSLASAGCIFKNPVSVGGLNAAQLIEGCGLKGRRVGGAMVSIRHANFIVNIGAASFNDVVGLIGLVKEEVWKRYNVNLETEVEILG